LPESLGQVRALQSLRGCGSLAGVSEEVCKASSPEEAAAIFLKQDAERRMSMDAAADEGVFVVHRLRPGQQDGVRRFAQS